EERTEGADPHGANPGEGSPCSAMRSPKFRTRKAIVPAQARNFFSQGQSAAGRSGGAGRGCNPIRYFTYISGWQTCQASSSILARGSFYLYGRRKYRPARRGTAQPLEPGRPRRLRGARASLGTARGTISGPLDGRNGSSRRLVPGGLSPGLSGPGP